MKIFITDTSEVRKIELKTWDNKLNNGWSPDCFGDVASDMYSTYPAADREADAEIAMTAAEYKDVVEWWENEINAYNSRSENNFFVEGLSADEIEAVYSIDLEYGLFAD